MSSYPPLQRLSEDTPRQSLMAEWTLDTFKEVPLTRADLTYGDALAGSQRLYKGLSRLFEKYFHPITPVTEKHMVCGVGVSACLDQLVEKICDVGDTILISRPYYSMSSIFMSSISFH